LRGHNFNVSAALVNIGSDFNNGSTGSSMEALYFDTGTFMAATLDIGFNQSSLNGTSDSSGASSGVVNIGVASFPWELLRSRPRATRASARR
jgi:hypothetical protein